MRTALKTLVENGVTWKYRPGVVYTATVGNGCIFRPIEEPNRDKLGTLFTLLFNARVALAAQAAPKEEQP